MDRGTKSINLNRSFTRLTLDEKRELRAMHEDLRNRFMAALADLQSIKSTAGRAHSHTDPMEALRDLQDVIKFSEIPNEYKRREKKALAVAGIQSIVKHHMQHENYRSPSQITTSQQGSEHGSRIVDPSRPLPLSFEARREHIMKKHTKRVESGLAGLFSKNSQIVEGVAQGPIPNLYVPASDSRRFAIEAERKAAVGKMVGNGSSKRSPRIDNPHQVQLHGVKVPKNFVPSCAVPHGPFQDPQVRSNVEKQNAERHAKRVSGAPFK